MFRKLWNPDRLGTLSAEVTWRLCLVLAILVVVATPSAIAGNKKGVKPKVSLQKVKLVVSTISGARPSHVRLDAVVQYGEATVSYAENIGEDSTIAVGQSATFDLPVDYDLPPDYAKLGPELCFVAKSFTGQEQWQFKASIDLFYSDGKKISFIADDLTLDANNQSTCKSFWHD